MMSTLEDVKRQLQFVYFSHLLTLKVTTPRPQVISICELANQNIKKIIFSSKTNDVNQNVLQMCLKIAPANFSSQSSFDTAFLSVFDIF